MFDRVLNSLNTKVDQSIDLQSKSIEWFLYDCNFGVKWVNKSLLFNTAVLETLKLLKILGNLRRQA